MPSRWDTFAMWQQAVERCPSIASAPRSLSFRLRTAARKADRWACSNDLELSPGPRSQTCFPWRSKNAPPEASPAK